VKGGGECRTRYRRGINIQTSSRQSAASALVLEQLYGALGQVTAVAHPRTFKLLQSGDRKLARKVIEEACEVTVEAVKRDADGVVRESADLLYHLVVLWCRVGIEPIEIWREMQIRADTLGIAEKLPKIPSAMGCGRSNFALDPRRGSRFGASARQRGN
jgi:phosphoribosyl-ATP pyrophosphohydrolase